MTNRLSYLAASPLILILASCASIINGTSQELHFASEPTAAQVFVNGQPVGSTPLTTDIKRNSPEVVLKKEGFKDQPVYLEYKLSQFFWVDFFLFPVFGLLADTITDATNVYEPTLYHTQLKPQ